MATRSAPAAYYRPAMLPPGYQTMAPAQDLLIPLIAFWALLLPAGLAVDIGGIKLPPYRIAILALMPFAVFEMGRRHLRLFAADYLFILGSLWAILAYFMNTGIDKAIEGGGSFVVDSLGSYLIGRAYITDVRKLRTFLQKALPGVIIIAIILAIEAISHRLLIADLFPQRARLDRLYEVRLGLLRARATFPHSISAGIFMTSLLPIYFMSGLRPNTKWAGTLASIGAVFTVSSSAFLTMGLTFFFFGYRMFFNVLLKLKERMIYLIYGFAALFVALEAFTGRGAIRTIIQYLTLDSASGYYRILIWDFGSASVANKPLFGIGDAPMPRPGWMIMETIDNHWLMLAVKFGLPAAIFTLLGVIIAIWRCGVQNRGLNEFDRATTMGAVFSLTTSAIVTWTSALWANNIAWFMLIAGVVVALSDQLPQAHRQIRRNVAQPVRATKRPI
jgi:hypothetical protein